MRRALGASPARLIRQWLTESSLIAAIGGIAGAIACNLGRSLVDRSQPNDAPIVRSISKSMRER